MLLLLGEKVGMRAGVILNRMVPVQWGHSGGEFRAKGPCHVKGKENISRAPTGRLIKSKELNYGTTESIGDNNRGLQPSIYFCASFPARCTGLV